MKNFALLLLSALVLCACGKPRDVVDIRVTDPKLGLQAWTFRDLTLAQTLGEARKLGIRYLQAYPGQVIGDGSDAKLSPDLPAADLARVRKLARDAGVVISSFGVLPSLGDLEKLLAFARGLGIREIVTEAPPDELLRAAPLFQKAGIRLSLHNHPKPSRYADPAFALETARQSGELVGVCADTGHWVRDGRDPVAALGTVAPRLHSLHLKDLSDTGVRAARDVPWGTGASRMAEQLAFLRKAGFRGIAYIEYEHRSPGLAREVAACADYFREAMRASVLALEEGRVAPPGYVEEIASRETWSGGLGAKSAKWTQPVPLFASDLANAEFSPGSWVMENGELVAKGGGEIWTREDYGDFVLGLEFQCAENSNSGVFLRCGDTKNWLNETIEVQILQSRAPDSKHVVGAIFDIQAPKRVLKINPGEWYRMVVVAKGPSIRVFLNEEEINEVNLDQWTEAGKNPDGSPNKFTRAYKDMPRSGKIGLQYHGTPIRFRSLVIERR